MMRGAQRSQIPTNSGDSLSNRIPTGLPLRAGFFQSQCSGKGALELIDKPLPTQGAACPFMSMQDIDFIRRGQLQKILPVGNHFKQWSHVSERVVLTGKMRPSAAPGILVWIANKIRGDRVHFNIPCR